MLGSKLPKHPWERVTTDLFELNKNTYLLIVNYYSHYPEVTKLKTTTTSSSIIVAMKSVFFRNGISQEVISDNGPQYDSTEIKEFTSSYGFNHITSSPYYPQGNGLAECMVKIVKNPLKETPSMYVSYTTKLQSHFLTIVSLKSS